MARFRFPLDPLLELRRREEEGHRRTVAELEERRRSIEEAIRSRQRDLQSAKVELRERLLGALDGTVLRAHAVDVMTVDRLARQKVLELAGLARIIAEARGRLIEAAQRRRAIELLRERRLEEWRQAADKRENDLLDELGSIAAGRRRSDSARDETPSETTP